MKLRLTEPPWGEERERRGLLTLAKVETCKLFILLLSGSDCCDQSVLHILSTHKHDISKHSS